MKNINHSVLLALSATFAITQVAIAGDFFASKDVFCGTEKCGTMELNNYASFQYTYDQNNDNIIDNLYGGVNIRGEFKNSKNLKFRWIQALLEYEGKLKFSDGTILPAVFIDDPPGSYEGFKNTDLLPYFPPNPSEYTDQPETKFDITTYPAQAGKDGVLSLKFETWLVCVIDENKGANENKAEDDTYTVAPLVGWTWGYKLINQDNGNNIKELIDFNVKQEPWNDDNGNWLTTPSQKWEKALIQVYGMGATQDRFNINLGDCKDCKELPKPNGNSKTPRTGQKKSLQMNFNAETQKLSFSQGVLDFANLAGDESLDPTFINDPILGATIQVTDLTLFGAVNNGFLFENGTLTISKGDDIFLTANIPNLLIDDNGLSNFGYNIWGALDFTFIDTTSPFLLDYSEFLKNNPLAPPELFGYTTEFITPLIANNQSFTTEVKGTSIAFSPELPEPTSTLSLLALGTLGATSTLKRKLKPKSPEKQTV